MARRRIVALVPVLLLLGACGVEAGTGERPATAGAPDQRTTSTTGLFERIDPPEPGSTTTTAPRKRNAADDLLSRAVANTNALDTFRVTSAVSLDIMGQRLQVTGSGGFDFGRKIANFEAATKGEGQDVAVTMRSDGKTLWLQPEGTGIDLPTGKSWVATTTDWMSDGHSMSKPSLLGVLLALEASAGARVGATKAIEGVSATEYTTTVNYGDVLAALGPDAKTFQAALSLQAPEPPNLAITTWVDADGIIRDFNLEIQDDGIFELGGTYDLAISEPGQPVEAPAAPDPATVLTGPAAERIVQQIIR